MRITALIAIALVTLTAPWAYSRGGKSEQSIVQSGSKAPTGTPLAEIPVTVDYFMSNHKTKPLTADDLTIAELQRRTNVYFNIISIDSNYWDKYKVMLASGDLPDLIFTTVPDAKRFGMEGLFLPLDSLLEEHGQNILNAFQEEKITEDIKALDGNTYFFPKIGPQQPEPFMVRQDWLEQFGIKPPETLEDIYRMLRTFKERDPAGDGQTLPYGSMMYSDPSICYLNAFYRAFTVDQDFLLKDGQMVWGPAQPEMRDAMVYLNRLYSEQLLDNEAPVLAKKQWEERVSSGRVGMIVYSSVRTDYFTGILQQKDPDAQMVGIAPPIGIDGKRHIAPFPRLSTSFCMTVAADSENAELIVRFFDYVFSPEGRRIISYGIEGETYTMVDGNPVFTERMYRPEAGWNMFVKSAIGGRRIASWPYDDALIQQLKGTMSLEALRKTWPFVDPPTPILNFDRQELSVIEAVYQDLVDKTSEYLLRFLIGSLSVDADWETYIDDLTRIGLLELEKAYQNAYGRRYP